MHCRVLRLRLNGIRTNGEAWHHGYVQMDGMGAKRLTLAMLESTPGTGVVDHLFNPTVVAWKGNLLHVRGIEPVSTPHGPASHVQEWQIELHPSEPGGVERWVAPGFWQG